MKPYVEVDHARTRLLKAARTLIRLKHSQAADEEIAKVLPQLQAEFDRAVSAGKLLELGPGELLKRFK